MRKIEPSVLAENKENGHRRAQGLMSLLLRKVGCNDDDFVFTPLASPSPTLIPSPSPTLIPSPSPSQPLEFISEPTGSPVAVANLRITVCNMEAGFIETKLQESSEEFAEVYQVLSEYNVIGESNNRGFWSIIPMATRFVSKVIGSRLPVSTTLNAISGLSDVTTIVSNFQNIFGSGSDSEDNNNANEVLGVINEELEEMNVQMDTMQGIIQDFRVEVFDRFDQIDNVLIDIQEQMADGFTSVTQAIEDGFAKSKLSELVLESLGPLEDAYIAYMNPDLTPEFVSIYEDTFRTMCLENHPPYSLFKVFYQHSCDRSNGCDLMGVAGPASNFMLDTFIEKASSLPMSGQDSTIWFRGSYGRVVLAAMVKLIYLHSVCLYQPADLCQNDDPTWSDRLEDMGTALEEVAASFSEAESRFVPEKIPFAFAVQSSTYHIGDPSLAIDGNTNWYFYGNSATLIENDPWWEGTLHRSIKFAKIKVYNRPDGGDDLII
ncbi:MAG: hypothetical protein ACPGED_09970, partial [Flavobacteriales bacterium]